MVNPESYGGPTRGGARRAAAMLLVGLLPLGCGGGTSGSADSVVATSPEADTLMHSLAQVRRAEGDCGREGADSATVPCVAITIDYPQISSGSGPSAALVDSVRAFILATAATSPGVSDSAVRYASVDSAADAFVAGYRNYYETAPEGPRHPWFLEREVKVVCNTPDIVSLRAEEARYTGGAHGMTEARLASFDSRTGRRLHLADWVTDSAAAAAAGERAFRDARDIPDRTSLVKAGFGGFEDGFALNDNVLRCGDTLTFHFDPYEVGPYVVGPTDFDVTLSAIADSAANRR